jgi:hypothetical protein
MIFQALNFPSKLQENEMAYFGHLQGIVSSVDLDAGIMVTRRSEDVSVRISPSDYPHFHPILENVKRFHRIIGIEVEFSKSMKAGQNIFYVIKI